MCVSGFYKGYARVSYTLHNCFCFVWWALFELVVRLRVHNTASKQHRGFSTCACFERPSSSEFLVNGCLLLFRDGQLSDLLALPYMDLCTSSRERELHVNELKPWPKWSENPTLLKGENKLRCCQSRSCRSERGEDHIAGRERPLVRLLLVGGSAVWLAPWGRTPARSLGSQPGAKGARSFRVGLRTPFISMSVVCWKLNCTLPIMHPSL